MMPSIRSRNRQLAGALALLLVAASPLPAQRLSPPLLQTSPSGLALPAGAAIGGAEAAAQQQRSGALLTLAGAAGAAAGAVGGAVLGYHLDRSGGRWAGGSEDPGLNGAVAGWLIGSAITTPAAVHLANDRRGSIGSAYVASALIAGVAGTAIYALSSNAGGYVFFAVPVAQIVSAVAIERATAR